MKNDNSAAVDKNYTKSITEGFEMRQGQFICVLYISEEKILQSY